MTGKDAYIVGGANSAGQAALHLARYAHRVTLLVRAQSLRAGMSEYLVKEVEAAANVEVRVGCEVVGGGGDGRLEHLVLREGGTGEDETVTADGLFVLIGARPQTDWLPEEIARDRQGFLLTGPDLPDDRPWPLKRRRLRLETSMPGVFAAGMSGMDPSSGWPLRSEKGRSRSSSSTASSRPIACIPGPPRTRRPHRAVNEAKARRSSSACSSAQE